MLSSGGVATFGGLVQSRPASAPAGRGAPASEQAALPRRRADALALGRMWLSWVRRTSLDARGRGRHHARPPRSSSPSPRFACRAAPRTPLHQASPLHQAPPPVRRYFGGRVRAHRLLWRGAWQPAGLPRIGAEALDACKALRLGDPFYALRQARCVPLRARQALSARRRAAAPGGEKGVAILFATSAASSSSPAARARGIDDVGRTTSTLPAAFAWRATGVRAADRNNTAAARLLHPALSPIDYGPRRATTSAPRRAAHRARRHRVALINGEVLVHQPPTGNAAEHLRRRRASSRTRMSSGDQRPRASPGACPLGVVTCEEQKSEACID